MLFSDFVQGSEFSDAGIGEDNVDCPLCRDDLVEAIKVGQLGNISLDASDVPTDCLHGLVKFFLATTGNEDVGALLHEELCGSQPDPGCAACNHCYFSLQPLSFGHR